MPTRLLSAERYYRWSTRLAERAVAQARREATLAGAALVVAQHQAAGATQVQAANTAMLAEQGITEAPLAALNAVAFATATSQLEAMLADLHAEMEWEFERLVASLVQDAGRAAQSVDLTTRPHVQHVRHLNPPSCSRCAVLAGRVYRYSEGFQRHPNCFPAGVIVSGPQNLAATRRWYEGELVVIRTAAGEELPATANHPVLTNKGWVPANLLKVGDRVVRSTRSEGALPLVVPDEQQAPSLVQDVGRADDMVPLGVMPTSAEDFHGDGGHGEVDVVLSDGLLWDRLQTAIAQFSY